MGKLLEVRHVSVSIDRDPSAVYAFVARYENLPSWAAGLAGGIREVDGEWVADSPMGAVKVRFAPANPLGVLDHEVVLPSGGVILNPMRVVPNGDGSELTFTLFRPPDMTEEAFAADRTAVERDLQALKRLLEASGR